MTYDRDEQSVKARGVGWKKVNQRAGITVWERKAISSRRRNGERA